MALGGGCSPASGCQSFGALPAAVQQGLLAPADVARALSRVLTARFRLGLMDPPARVPYAAVPPDVVDSPPHRRLAWRAAAESVVLLVNRDRTLPLDPARRLRLAVVGPNADAAAFGNYNGRNRNFSTVVDGVRRYAAEVSALPSRREAPQADHNQPQTLPYIESTLARRARGANYFPYFPRSCLPFPPFFVPVLGTPEKAGVM